VAPGVAGYPHDHDDAHSWQAVYFYGETVVAEEIQIADVVLNDDGSGRLRLELDSFEPYTYLSTAGITLLRDALTAWLEAHTTD
jgi:protein involved in sex pheromone biosynthesis